MSHGCEQASYGADADASSACCYAKAIPEARAVCMYHCTYTYGTSGSFPVLSGPTRNCSTGLSLGFSADKMPLLRGVEAADLGPYYNCMENAAPAGI